jgi:hypothetical protein
MRAVEFVLPVKFAAIALKLSSFTLTAIIPAGEGFTNT